MQKLFSSCIVLCLVISSCITPKIHNALKADYDNAKTKLEQQDKELFRLAARTEELEAEIAALRSNMEILRNDSVQNGQALLALQSAHDELSKMYDLLVNKNSRELAEKAKATKVLLQQMEDLQNQLLSKEDQMKGLSNSLEEKQSALDYAQNELNARAAKVIELESIIHKKDSLVSLLKVRVSKALLGIEGNGLTVVQKHGKVYISLEESLLFSSGRYEIETKGLNALNKLAEALANQSDLEILVEGHTDSIPMSKGLIKDNWDLSVLRSTAVVKVLMNNPKIHPTQLSASGRGEYLPIKTNTTPEGRAANRRIEIILTPKLDDLFNLLEE